MKNETPKKRQKIEYFENGQKCREGYYKDDKEDGLLTEWDENGQITVSNWKDGECISGDC